MSLIAHNALCPCHSGRKYKTCCFARHREIGRRHETRGRLVSRVVEWLLRDNFATALWTLDEGFFGHIAEVDRPSLFRMPEGLRSIVLSNAYDWLLFDGEIAAGDKRQPVWKRVLGPGGPKSLGTRDREWIARAAAAPLGIYEVVEVHRGLGCAVRNLADRDARPIPITEPTNWESFHRGDVLGLRLVQVADVWERSSAAYGFDPRSLPDIEDEIRRVDNEVTDPTQRDAALGAGIRELWTQLVFLLFRASAGTARTLAAAHPMLGWVAAGVARRPSPQSPSPAMSPLRAPTPYRPRCSGSSPVGPG